jgi:hypothetical protein
LVVSGIRRPDERNINNRNAPGNELSIELLAACRINQLTP